MKPQETGRALGGRLRSGGLYSSASRGSNSSSSFFGRPVRCPEMPSLSLRSAASFDNCDRPGILSRTQ